MSFYCKFGVSLFSIPGESVVVSELFITFLICCFVLECYFSTFVWVGVSFGIYFSALLILRGCGTLFY